MNKNTYLSLFKNLITGKLSKTAGSLLAAGVLLFSTAQASLVTYNFDGLFAQSDWNFDSTNAVRTPGGPFTGYFTIDTDTLSVTALDIDTTFYSISGGVATSGTYEFGLGGTDDVLGTSPATIVRLGSNKLILSLTTDLTGSTTQNGSTGSMIQILDQRLTRTRINRPRLTLFMEGVDFSQGAPDSVDLVATEQVWNINRGTGITGYSGAQSNGQTTAVVPEPKTFALVLGLMIVPCLTLRRMRSGGEHTEQQS